MAVATSGPAARTRGWNRRIHEYEPAESLRDPILKTGGDAEILDLDREGQLRELGGLGWADAVELWYTRGALR